MPAYFCSLEVENVRCFAGKQRLELTHDGRPAKWTVLLGDNGVGKTTLLQCLYAMAPVVEGHGTEATTLPRAATNLRNVALGRAGCEDGRVTTTLSFGSLATAITNDELATISIPATDVVTHYNFGVDASHEHAPCLCCAYGASRRIGDRWIEDRDVHDSGESLFSADVPLVNAVEWLLQADYAARGTGGKRAVRRRDAVKQALIDLLPDVSAIREAGLDEEPRPRPRVEVHTPYGWVSIRALSLGYQTMIAWIVDLASRMFEVYADSDDPLAEAAIVLVDEIDLHLHPRWQRQITSHLDTLFPNVQFIVTAHSPLVVQAPGVSNVAVLRRNGDHVEILNDPDEVRGWRVDQILTSDLFGLESARPVDVERDLERQRQLLLLDDPTEAEQQELRELDTRLAKLPPGELPRDREAWSLAYDLAKKLHDMGSKP